jgi:glyceraldehyde-3-phosphate dehydrogenase type I
VTYEQEDGGNTWLCVLNKRILVVCHRDPTKCPWKELNVDVVVEASGVFRSYEDAMVHCNVGAKKVLITAPPKGKGVKQYVYGVNHQDYNLEEDHVISMASCTTNSLAPVLKVVEEQFGVKRAFITTVHSFTNDQATLDAFHSDPRRARAASSSIIPTTTGAAEAVAKVIPSLEGKLTGLALRVPTPTVSITDLVMELNQSVTREQMHQALDEAAKGSLNGILHVSYEPLVSCDYKGTTYSSIVDAELTKILDGDLVKLMIWYDNEYGYARRLLDVSKVMFPSS